MKATLLLAVLALLALATFVEAAAITAGLTAATARATQAAEPAWMLLSGAMLIGVASAVRRFVP
ncbi:MAG: hypothetical protein HOQ29_00125 [Acidobacteria bacterium]|nr:hypothetical protein [Acidobacteriota bacterium]